MPLPLDFDAFARLPEARVNWGHGAALLARDVDPYVDVEAVGRALDDLARPLQGIGLAHLSPAAQAERLSAHLFDGEGFRPLSEQPPRTEGLLVHEVLRRRRGSPISLAMVYCEVARRIGIAAAAVRLPGRYWIIVGLSGAAERGQASVFVDPSDGGVTPSGAALAEVEAARGNAAPTVEQLRPRSVRSSLARMVLELKHIHVREHRPCAAFLALYRLATLFPDDPQVLRERARLAEQLGAYDAARSDISRLLALDANAADAEQLRQALAQLPTPAERFRC